MPSRLASPSRRSRVTPGRSSTSASFLPTSRLNRVDLPTLGRPTIATVGGFAMARGSALPPVRGQPALLVSGRAGPSGGEARTRDLADATALFGAFDKLVAEQ